MKASDITDERIYGAVRECQAARDSCWASRWDIYEKLAEFPPKVIDAKLSQMVRKKRLKGCSVMHNCRGDFELPDTPPARVSR